MNSPPAIHALVIEDDPAVAELIRRSLESDGMTVHLAPNLTTARTSGRRGTPA